MFVSDRHFCLVDPARSLYSTAVYYLSVMVVNAFVTVLNSGILLLILYSMVGEHLLDMPCLGYLLSDQFLKPVLVARNTTSTSPVALAVG